MRKLPRVTSEQVTEYLKNEWKHCLRCELAEIRTDPETGEGFGRVPRAFSYENPEGVPVDSKWHFILEAPDEKQQSLGNFLAVHKGEATSPIASLIQWTFEALEGQLPAVMEDCSYSFAMGCRPVDFMNPSRIIKPSATQARLCRPRWNLELGLANPPLTYIAGPNALAVVRPDLGTRAQYGRLLGEIVSIPIHLNRSPELLPERGEVYGYVGPSVENIIRTARDDQLDILDNISEWDGMPCDAPATEPVLDWLWHFKWYMWLTEALVGQVSGESAELPQELLNLSEKLNQHYDTMSVNMFRVEEFLAQLLEADPERVRMFMEGKEEENGDEEG